jgi:hypothetical protein
MLRLEYIPNETKAPPGSTVPMQPTVTNEATRLAHIAELEMAERHVVRAQKHVAEQEQRVEQLRPGSSHHQLAMRLLGTFKATLNQHLYARDMVKRELERDSAVD